jgi:hypothetical protein
LLRCLSNRLCQEGKLKLKYTESRPRATTPYTLLKQSTWISSPTVHSGVMMQIRTHINRFTLIDSYEGFPPEAMVGIVVQ